MLAGKEIKELRRKYGMSQKKLADAVGLSKKNGDVTLRRLENGSTTQPPSTLLQRAIELYFANLGLEEENFKLKAEIAWLEN